MEGLKRRDRVKFQRALAFNANIESRACKLVESIGRLSDGRDGQGDVEERAKGEDHRNERENVEVGKVERIIGTRIDGGEVPVKKYVLWNDFVPAQSWSVGT